MKKILASLIVLALVAPAMAEVAVTASDGNGVLTITVTPSNGAVIRGVALLLGWDDTNTGDGVVTSASVTGLTTNIDYYVDNPIVDADEDNVPDDPGHPAADPAGPGVATLPSADVSLCSGYLDSTGAQGGLTDPAVFTVNYSGTSATLVSIALDTLRGGIVGDTLGDITVQATQLVEFGLTCFDYDLTGDDIVNINDLNDLVTYVDLNKPGGRWSVPDTAPGWNPIYDFTGDNVVNINDLNDLVTYVDTNKPGGRWSVPCT